MLRNTFIHLPGIGLKKEKSLWEGGILTWDDFEKEFLSQRTLFPTENGSTLARAFYEARDALDRGDMDFFADLLPSNEHYRIALDDPASTIFLDIETTGLSLYYDHITLIGASNAERYYLYTKGEDISVIEQALARAKSVITFNGTLFDLKFVRQEFPHVRIPKAHVDLRFFGLPFELRGTQKYIETKLGLRRPAEVRAIRGERAPILWYRFTHGDIEAGKQLIEYNYWDVEGMKFILDAILGRIWAKDSLAAKISRTPRFFNGHRAIEWAREPGRLGEHELDKIRVSLHPYRGHVGPHTKYEDLAHDARSQSLRVIGIDLTGSEKRPTGWSLLAGRKVVTKLLRSDKEIIRETVAANPDVVSVDSPLSLPKGRKRVTNDDPGRKKFGITRECERILKKRGVNVYPSLIDSMQNLTARGIRLARKLRAIGIPVIECYPGAAQDIMGIPRKRASLDYLKEGLGEFGIEGEFQRANVSHDELDAITAAVVGLFFWSGKFEALGNDDEEYLIIPDLLVPPDPWRNRTVIGFSGPIASGKTTGARFVEKYGYAYGRYSQVLAAILEEQEQPVNRGTLQAFGDRIHRKSGQRWLCRELARRLPRDQNLVVDGLRFPEDHAYLVESFGPAFLHIHVTASECVRKDRYVADGNREADFRRAARHPVEAKVARLAELADKCVINERTKHAYEEELGDIIAGNTRIASQRSPENTVAVTADR